MPTKDPRVDAYIAKSADFAKPILTHLRRLVHQGCPDVAETMKWNHVSFEHKGMLAGIAAFKEHCSFGFWKHALIFGKDDPFLKPDKEGMGICGKIGKLADLPDDKTLLGYIREAVRLNDEGIKIPKPKSNVRKELVIPPILMAALKKNKKAQATFDSFSYSHKKEYVEWITEAKTEPTREKRLATTLEWLTEGKARNWKYANC